MGRSQRLRYKLTHPYPIQTDPPLNVALVGVPLVGIQQGPIRPPAGRHEACPYAAYPRSRMLPFARDRQGLRKRQVSRRSAHIHFVFTRDKFPATLIGVEDRQVLGFEG